MKKIAGLLSLLLVAGCATPGKRTAIGAGAGAAAGATVGAIIGHQSGNRDKGALLGGVLGGLLGGTIGNRLDKQAQELAQIAETRRTESGIVTTLKNNLLFDTAKADLKPVAADSVNQISDILKKYPENKIIVVGFTDDRGSDAYNPGPFLATGPGGPPVHGRARRARRGGGGRGHGRSEPRGPQHHRRGPEQEPPGGTANQRRTRRKFK
jgi:hypothetical protein